MDKNTTELLLRTLLAEKERIEDAIAELRSQLPTSAPNGRRAGRPPKSRAVMDSAGTTAPSTGRRRRRMSAAAKKKISDAMKRRYAELRKASK